MSLNEKLWMWGYAQENIGVPVPFTANSKSYCSLESAAAYFGMDNTVFMNSMHSLEGLEENLQFVRNSKQILCGLPHGETDALAGAEAISRMSLKLPNIKGIVLDDFLQLSGHPTTPELVRSIRERLRCVNPGLEIFVVMYSDVNHLDITPYLELIDGIILWRWVSTEHFWRAEFDSLLHRFKVNTGKKLFHGVYLQNYGEHASAASPMDLDLWKLQWQKILNALRSSDGFLDGCVLLQNGWVGSFEFRDQVVWLKETLDWFCHTTTER